jgi:hypothetical protein
MGFKATWTPDDTSISTQLILCLSSRQVAEHNIRFSGKPMIETVELFRSATVANFYRFNRRCPFSFEVMRDMDFANNPFQDPEAAISFAADHCAGSTKTLAVAGTGVLAVQLVGPVTSKTLTFNNAVVQGIDLIQWEGIVVTFRYDFVTASVTIT